MHSKVELPGHPKKPNFAIGSLKKAKLILNWEKDQNVKGNLSINFRLSTNIICFVEI
jgi:hypothetical protein